MPHWPVPRVCDAGEQHPPGRSAPLHLAPSTGLPLSRSDLKTALGLSADVELGTADVLAVRAWLGEEELESWALGASVSLGASSMPAMTMAGLLTPAPHHAFLLQRAITGQAAYLQTYKWESMVATTVSGLARLLATSDAKFTAVSTHVRVFCT